ncbi:hypothetical protein scyTo_0008858 [Scyliorhinus torazame]|uniref:Adenylate cyclase N-terminal domain-containing protein n=1 Tax=Scyliorhinus torazame TaxID=75743 RepID=A0A401PEI1_SCYTO|nr:hypothetical protein [Scyliorhinus torazame]
MSRANSVSPPGGGPPPGGGNEHKAAWAEGGGCTLQSRANGIPIPGGRSREKPWGDEEDEEDSQRRLPGKTARLSIRSKSAWQEQLSREGGPGSRNSVVRSRHQLRLDGEVRPKSVEMRLEEQTMSKLADVDSSASDVEISFADCCHGLFRIFQSKKFQSEKLERLYQRYFFRLNQSSLTMLMGVLVLVCAVMLAFHCAHGSYELPYLVVLAVTIVLVLVLMVVCNRNGFHQDHMWIICYLLIVVILVVDIIGLLLVEPRSASEGIWWTIFFIYIIYTLLPIRMRAAVISGILLSALHLGISWKRNIVDPFLWKQVRTLLKNKQLISFA